MDKKKKIKLEGKLFVLVEETGEGNVDVCIEIAGVNLFNIFRQNNGERVKLNLEVLNG